MGQHCSVRKAPRRPYRTLLAHRDGCRPTNTRKVYSMDETYKLSSSGHSSGCDDHCPNFFLQSTQEETLGPLGTSYIECPRLDCCRLSIHTADGCFQFVPRSVPR